MTHLARKSFAVFLAIYFALGLVSSARADDAKPKDAKVEDAKAIAGDWVAEAATINGEKLKGDALAKIRMVFHGDEVFLEDGDSRGEAVQGTHTLDAAKSPKTIDVVRKARGLRRIKDGGNVYGIYELDGDTLQVCWGEEESDADARPKEFEAAAGSGLMLVKFKRIKPTKASPLEGKWQMTTGTRDGRAVDEEEASSVGMEFVGNVVFLTEKRDRKTLTRFKYDADKSPAEIDLDIGRGKTITGIYEIKDGELQLCFRRDTGGGGAAERPTKFESPEGSDLALMVMKQEKDEKK